MFIKISMLVISSLFILVRVHATECYMFKYKLKMILNAQPVLPEDENKVIKDVAYPVMFPEKEKALAQINSSGLNQMQLLRLNDFVAVVSWHYSHNVKYGEDPLIAFQLNIFNEPSIAKKFANALDYEIKNNYMFITSKPEHESTNYSMLRTYYLKLSDLGKTDLNTLKTNPERILHRISQEIYYEKNMLNLLGSLMVQGESPSVFFIIHKIIDAKTLQIAGAKSTYTDFKIFIHRFAETRDVYFPMEFTRKLARYIAKKNLGQSQSEMLLDSIVSEVASNPNETIIDIINRLLE
jgi:hypothetical protein